MIHSKVVELIMIINFYTWMRVNGLDYVVHITPYNESICRTQMIFLQALFL